MRNKLFAALALGFMCIASSCKDRAVEVITEDSSYKIDPNAVYVDIPAPFIYNENNIVRYNGATEITVNAKITLGQVVLSSNQIALPFKIRRALANDARLELVEDRSLLAKYSGAKDGFLPLPEGVLTGLSFAIPANQTTFTSNLTIARPEALNDTSGYLTAFRLTAPELTGANFAQGSEVIYLKINVSRSNITAVSQLDQSTLMPFSSGEITPSTNSAYESYATVSTLFDGNKSNDWYGLGMDTSGTGSVWINLDFAIPSEVSAITIHQRIGFRPVAKLKIKTSADGRTWDEQGEVSFTQTSGAIHIQFNAPIEVSKLQLYDFTAQNPDRFIVLREIELFRPF